MAEKILALDVHYTATTACAAGILFDSWTAERAVQEEIVRLDHPEQYLPGEFFRRELPCLLAALQQFDVKPDLILVDGYVWLDQERGPGLGARLYQSLEQRVPVVGIAKTRFRGAPAVELCRGKSVAPLFISTVGVDDKLVAERVRAMFGPYRIPYLLKRVDQLSRGIST